MNRYRPLRWVGAVLLSVFALGCTAEAEEEHGFTQADLLDPDTLDNGGEDGAFAADTEGADLASLEAILEDDEIVTMGFSQCGSSCPSGYHVESRSCTAVCNGGTACSFNQWPNTVYCSGNSGWFWQCGTTCPSGWHVEGTQCLAWCTTGMCTPSSWPNAALCVPN